MKQETQPLAMLRLWTILCLLLHVVQPPHSVKAADDVADVRPCELETIINQLLNPSPEYQLHVSALRSQLANILRERQLAEGAEQGLANDYDYLEEDKRSVSSLAAQGLLRANDGKRSVATLAKNGQLPTPTPEELGLAEWAEKRNVGSLARSSGLMGYGKRNIGVLARDFQLPQTGKRNLATLARQGLLSSTSSSSGARNEPKRNMAAIARYNSNRLMGDGAALAEKRNLGALKGSPVHGGIHQKREDEELLNSNVADADLWALNPDLDYMEPVPLYWMYPSYGDLDWADYGRAQKRFLDTTKDPELFGIENARPPLSGEEDEDPILLRSPQKRHIGAVYRSGFLPSYRALRSLTGTGGRRAGFVGSGVDGGGGRFSRSVGYYPRLERLRQPIADVCKRCFLPNRPVVHWGATGVRGRLPKYIQEEHAHSINTNALPSSSLRHPVAALHSWGTPPRITALLQRRSFRRQDDPIDNNMY